MGELDALTSYITGIVKRCVSEVFAEEAPKLMGKETKRYYSIDEVCEKLGIRKSAFHDKANKGQFIIVKDGQSTLVALFMRRKNGRLRLSPALCADISTISQSF